MYGRRIGLLLIPPTLVFHAFLIDLNATDLDYFQLKLTGIIFVISTVILIGTLRKNYDEIRKANSILDQEVEKRSLELQSLTSELLDKAEQRRVIRGQEIHDGMGQQLTGAQLMSTSLLDQLQSEKNDATPLAERLVIQACDTQNHLRRIARLLFPIRISQVGLTAAISELADSLQEIRQIEFTIKDATEPMDVQEKNALQIYRICQETAMHIIINTNATHIEVSLAAKNNDCIIEIIHNGTEKIKNGSDFIMKLIHYRLNQLTGTLTRRNVKENSSYLFAIPDEMVQA